MLSLTVRLVHKGGRKVRCGPFRPVGKTLPISLIHIYWCETLGCEEAPAPTHHPSQARLALRTGSMSPKSYSLSPDWPQSPPPSLLPFAPPHPPLGLPSNWGRVAEIFSLLQAKARQHHGPRRRAGWGLGDRASCALGEPDTSVCPGMGSGKTGPHSPRGGRGWDRVVM